MARSFDAFLEARVGAFGAWHVAVTSLVAFCMSSPLLQMQQLAFMAPPHWCARPQLEGRGWSAAEVRNRTAPRNEAGGVRQCHQFNATFHSFDELQPDVFNASSLPLIPCQSGWSYDDDAVTFRESFSREFDLVCDRSLLVSWTRSAYMLGMIPGPIVGGFFADRYGRRSTSVVVSVLTGAVAIATSYVSNSITSFWILRFLTGVAASASNTVGYIWAAELTTARHQNLFNLIFSFVGNHVTEFACIALAFWLQEWRLLHAILSLPQLLLVFFPLFIPESPRWLLAMGRRQEGAQAVSRMAATTRKAAAREAIQDAVLSEAFVIDGCEENTDSENNWKSLFCNKVYRKRLALLLYSWTAVNIAAYGLNYFTVRLEGNIYVTASCLNAFGAIFVCFKSVLFACFDHKKTLIGCYLMMTLLTGACVLTLQFFPGHVVSIALATMSFGISISVFGMLFTIAPGIFPTSTQNFAFGLYNGFSRIGAVSATFLEKLDTLTGMKWFPMMIISAVIGANILVVIPLSMRNATDLDITEEIMCQPSGNIVVDDKHIIEESQKSEDM